MVKKNGYVLLEDEALRDGLQIEPRIFSTAEKIHLFTLLKNAGLQRIQIGSFVNPKIVPQMADTEEIINTIDAKDKQIISALVLNERGLERALATKIQHVSMSVSVSDTHSRKNANRSAAESLESMVRLIEVAISAGATVRAGLQCAFGCVYEGKIREETIFDSAEKLIKSGAKEINFADTTGMATPISIKKIINKACHEFPEIGISLHLHDTRGLGLLNMLSGYEAGARSFDVSAGGLGGCPFVKGAAGNVATEDAVHMFKVMGIETGVDIEKVCCAVDFLQVALGRKLPGHMSSALKAKGDINDKNA